MTAQDLPPPRSCREGGYTLADFAEQQQQQYTQGRHGNGNGTTAALLVTCFRKGTFL